MEELGGVGSLAHEYAHAMDFYFGYYKDSTRSDAWLSGVNGSTRTLPDQELLKSRSIRGSMERLINGLIWNGTKHTSYYRTLESRVKKSMRGYWLNRQELFARTFEAWVCWRLAGDKRYNHFLTKAAYKDYVYPDQKLLEKLNPCFTELVAKMKSYL
jgi:hypothetical protein